MNVKEIKDPHFLKELNLEQLEDLCCDLRKFTINSVAKTGGHLSSNLGIVELTVGMHYVFDAPFDKFIFDVGHQTYIHKILTGRAQYFNTLRQYQGLSGFQKRDESIYDCYEAGHSSTSISAAIGMAIARDLNQQSNEVIAVIGDASIVSGEALEALNHLGSIENKVIVIFNDNAMSISQPVGGFHEFLAKVRISNRYNDLKDDVRPFAKKSRLASMVLIAAKNIKDFFRRSLIDDSIFQNFNLQYYGPVDGNNLNEVIKALNIAKKSNNSIVLHFNTKKGLGYQQAQDDTTGCWHGIGPFDVKTGLTHISQSTKTSWSCIVANHLEKLMEEDRDIVAITPAMIKGSCLDHIFEKFPDRAIDVGIAEQHAATSMSGLAIGGKKPFLSIYSSFMQRAYDQFNHDLARMKIPCLIAIDRAGVVGSDGPTHHGIFDIGFLLPLPDIVLFAPRDSYEAKLLMNAAFKNNDRPYFIRLPRNSVENIPCSTSKTIEIGTWQTINPADQYDLTIVCYGDNVNKVIAHFKSHKYRVRVVNARFLKPMDTTIMAELAKETKPVIVYETDLVCNSLGYNLAAYMMEHAARCVFKIVGIQDSYPPQGTIEEIFKHEGVDLLSLEKEIERVMENEKRKN
ncbi:MAG: 1-deoxy-D-xylulose-5-phosphate synthase [Erysipelotrichaceae bacterium]|nr:1-deoxy-D-xylulose-5-phosphate synthase [Erysipelotrichaceae bacterium]